MSKDKRDALELLAPGGSFAGAKAAFQAGADAVYMGGDRFSARAYAESASEEHSLENALDYAHLHGKNIYLTLNTLLKQHEIEKELYHYVAPLYERGIDAVLVQDLGVFRFLHREFPDLPLHASTQMTVTSASSARLLQDLGMTRVVAARELNLKELRRIYEATGMEVEAFVHGAICYCYSGQCLYSGVIGGRSGNRGRCAQPCRLPYTAFDSSGKPLNKPADAYLLSLKDMCTLQYLPDMAEAGVMSFKIEGRMKSPLYTAGVVSIYRKYLDRYQENGRKNWKVDEKDRYALSQFFDRGGFTDAYLTRHNGRDMMALKEKAKLRTPDQNLIKETEKKYIDSEWKEKIRGTVTIRTGEYANMCLEYGSVQVKAESREPVASAKKRPLLESNVRKQFSKTGATLFVIDSLEICLSEGAFMPVQAMNELRRDALNKLEAAILEKKCRKAAPFQSKDTKQEETAYEEPLEVVGQIADLKYLPFVLESEGIQAIYLDSACVKFDKLREIVSQCHEKNKKCFLVMARIWREPAIRELNEQYGLLLQAGLDGLVVGSLDVLQELSDRNCPLSIVIDHTLYSWNTEAKEQISDLLRRGNLKLLRLTAPLELNKKELAQRGCLDSEIVVYGYLPMMVTAGCIRKTTGRCTQDGGLIHLTDRKGISFTASCCCKYCYNIIYNSLPSYLLDKMEQIKTLHPKAVRLSFTVETPEEVKAVLSDWNRASGQTSFQTAHSITRGHFTRGVL